MVESKTVAQGVLRSMPALNARWIGWDKMKLKMDSHVVAASVAGIILTAIAESQGDLLNARSNETLLAPDADTVQLRRVIKDAFVGSLDGRRTGIESASLAFPI